MNTHAHSRSVWLPGFFTGILHAVTDLEHPMLFHGVPVVWSQCGLPAALTTGRADSLVCPRCVARVGFAPAAR